LNNKRQSVGPKPDSRPCLEGARYKCLTSCSCLLSPTSPFSHAYTRTHHQPDSSPPGLAQWTCYIKASAYGSRVGWTPARTIHTYNATNVHHLTSHSTPCCPTTQRCDNKLLRVTSLHPMYTRRGRNKTGQRICAVNAVFTKRKVTIMKKDKMFPVEIIGERVWAPSYSGPPLLHVLQGGKTGVCVIT